MAEYIKREEAEQALINTPLKFTTMSGDYIHISQSIGVIKCVKDADVAPVVHGRWIAVDEYMTDECSNCGARINIEEFDDCSYHPKYGNVRLDYCPNCGAKMDENT